MSPDDLVQAYVAGRVSRRVFVRRLVAGGLATSTAATYAELLRPEWAFAAAAADYQYGVDYNPNYGTDYGPSYGVNYGVVYGPEYGTNEGVDYGPDYRTNFGTDYGPNYGVTYGTVDGPNYGRNRGTVFGVNYGPNYGTTYGPSYGPNYWMEYGPSYGPNYGTSRGADYGPNYGSDLGPSYGPNYGSTYGPAYGPNYGHNYGPAYPPASPHQNGNGNGGQPQLPQFTWTVSLTMSRLSLATVLLTHQLVVKVTTNAPCDVALTAELLTGQRRAQHAKHHKHHKHHLKKVNPALLGTGSAIIPSAGDTRVLIGVTKAGVALLKSLSRANLTVSLTASRGLETRQQSTSFELGGRVLHKLHHHHRRGKRHP